MPATLNATRDDPPTESVGGVPCLMDAHAVAKVFGVKYRTVLRKVEVGELPAPRVNQSRFKRWHPDDVNSWLKTCH